jgi:hypothetical protein
VKEKCTRERKRNNEREKKDKRPYSFEFSLDKWGALKQGTQVGFPVRPSEYPFGSFTLFLLKI